MSYKYLISDLCSINFKIKIEDGVYTFIDFDPIMNSDDIKRLTKFLNEIDTNQNDVCINDIKERKHD